MPSDSFQQFRRCRRHKSDFSTPQVLHVRVIFLFTEPLHWTRTHAQLSRANTTAHHLQISSVGTHRLKVIWVARHSLCSTFIPSRDVFVRRPVSSVPSRFVFAFGSVIKTFQRPPHPLPEQPKRARSLEWVWPNGCISTKHRLWAQARQLLQLHGSGPHAFQYRRQPSQFLVLGRRYHDCHKSRWFTEFRSIQQQQTSSSWQSFITVGIFGIWKQSVSHVSGRLAPQEIGAELMRESVATTLFSSQSKGKRDRDTLCIRWERKSPKHLWTERWFCRPRRREAQQILYQAEAEARNWERRNSDFAFREINQEFESQRFQLHQASPRADQAQRDKINVYGDLELRNRLFQEDYARDCQEFEELRKICCEEIDQAIQARIEGLSLQQYRNPSIVSQMVAQILDLQNKVNSLSYAR